MRLSYQTTANDLKNRRKQTMGGYSMLNKITIGIVLVVVTTLTACSPTNPTPTISLSLTETPASTPVTGMQEVNGTSLYYEIIGVGSPLVVLHGGPGGSHSYFLPSFDALSDEYQLYFYDQRGTGLSDGHLDLAAISIDQFVEDLEGLRVSFNLEKMSLLGHSWGGIIALAYALKYPAHLNHLILVDSRPVSNTFGIQLSETIQQRVNSLSSDEQNKLTTTCNRPIADLSPVEIETCNQIDAELKFYDPSKAVSVDWPDEENTIKNSDTVRALITSSFNKMQNDMDTQLSSLQVPTLIIHGDFDPIPQGSSEYLQQHIPGSQIVIIPQSGHFPFIEQPEQFVAAVRSFLQK